MLISKKGNERTQKVFVKLNKAHIKISEK
jgi:hypothetical protein